MLRFFGESFWLSLIPLLLGALIGWWFGRRRDQRVERTLVEETTDESTKVQSLLGSHASELSDRDRRSEAALAELRASYGDELDALKVQNRRELMVAEDKALQETTRFQGLLSAASANAAKADAEWKAKLETSQTEAAAKARAEQDAALERLRADLRTDYDAELARARAEWDADRSRALADLEGSHRAALEAATERHRVELAAAVDGERTELSRVQGLLTTTTSVSEQGSARVASLEAEIGQAQAEAAKSAEAVARVREERDEALAGLRSEHDAVIQRLRAEADARVAELEQQRAEAVVRARTDWEAEREVELARVRSEHDAAIGVARTQLQEELRAEREAALSTARADHEAAERAAVAAVRGQLEAEHRETLEAERRRLRVELAAAVEGEKSELSRVQGLLATTSTDGEREAQARAALESELSAARSMHVDELARLQADRDAAVSAAAEEREAALRTAFDERETAIAAALADRDAAVAAMHDERDAALEALRSEHATALGSLQETHADTLDALNVQHRRAVLAAEQSAAAEQARLQTLVTTQTDEVEQRWTLRVAQAETEASERSNADHADAIARLRAELTAEREAEVARVRAEWEADRGAAVAAAHAAVAAAESGQVSALSAARSEWDGEFTQRLASARSEWESEYPQRLAAARSEWEAEQKAKIVVAPDDLKRVEGIGPKFDTALRGAGITTFVGLRDASASDVQGILEGAGLSFVPSLPTWSRQAAFLAAGDDAGFQAYSEWLVAGREPAERMPETIVGAFDRIGWRLPEPAAPDDLQRIEGIGPKIAAALNAAGIVTFAQLRDTDNERLQAMLDDAKLSFAPSLPTWSRQSGMLAVGDEAGFRAYTEHLVAGREPEQG